MRPALVAVFLLCGCGNSSALPPTIGDSDGGSVPVGPQASGSSSSTGAGGGAAGSNGGGVPQGSSDIDAGLIGAGGPTIDVSVVTPGSDDAGAVTVPGSE
jgi:hypothetical protein